jgi:hypothetical protein
MRVLVPVLLVLGLAACGYEPPAQTDVSTPTYKADLDACQDSAGKDVNARNAKTGLAWFASPVSRWGQIERTTLTCMAAKGYGNLRWCSEDEMRAGSKSGNLVVTSAGIRCSEPPAPARRRAS